MIFKTPWYCDFPFQVAQILISQLIFAPVSQERTLYLFWTAFSFRYDISNCLFEATYEKVLEECNCTPYFHWAGLKEYQNFCRGSSLICMNEIFSRLGEFNDVLHFNENGKASNYKVSDKNAPRRKCLAACENQVINLPYYLTL